MKTAVCTIPVNPDDGLEDLMAILNRILPKKPQKITVWRWRKRGRGGSLLPHIKIDGEILSTTTAVNQWIMGLSQSQAAEIEEHSKRSVIETQLSKAGLTRTTRRKS